MALKYLNNLNRAIERSGMSLAEISEETFIGERTLYTYRAGHVPVPKERREALSDCLGYSIEYLFPPLSDIREDYTSHSGSEEAKDLEALLVLRSHCGAHPADEDALQQLMELLGKVGRYREIERWYDRFMHALRQDVAPREPDASTIELLAQLRVQQGQADLSKEQDETPGGRTIPSVLVTSPSPGSDHIASSPFQSVDPQGILVGKANAPSLDANNLRDSSIVTQEDTSQLDATSPIDQETAVEVQRLTGEYESDQENTTEENNAMDAKKRNSIQQIGTALGGSLLLNSTLGLQPFSLVQRGPKLHDEELLDLCETEIPIWWRLYFEGNHAEIRNVLSGYLFRLSTLAQRLSRYQQRAGNLASQVHGLAWLLAIQRQDFSTALMHTQQASQYAVIAGDFTLQTCALTSESYIYDLAEDPDSMLYGYQKAFQHCDKLPPNIQGRTYAGLAKAHAFLKQEKEADHFLGLARDTFPEHPEEEPTYIYTRYSSFTVTNDEVVTWLQLNKPDNAWQACEKIARMVTIKPRQRAELLIRQAEASFALGKMDQCCSYVQQAVIAAWHLGSDLRYQQAYRVYRLLLGKWPREKAVKDLAVLFLRSL